ncbi:hypothetical protein NL676_007075 [Syzygium grande]|nr:hypothetical protein NL676_007075 [Syzygium grande]
MPEKPRHHCRPYRHTAPSPPAYAAMNSPSPPPSTPSILPPLQRLSLLTASVEAPLPTITVATITLYHELPHLAALQVASPSSTLAAGFEGY